MDLIKRIAQNLRKAQSGADTKSSMDSGNKNILQRLNTEITNSKEIFFAYVEEIYGDHQLGVVCRAASKSEARKIILNKVESDEKIKIAFLFSLEQKFEDETGGMYDLESLEEFLSEYKDILNTLPLGSIRELTGWDS